MRSFQEILGFLASQYPHGIRLKAVADRLGVSPQAVSAMLRKPDMKLSMAEHIVSRYDYTLTIQWPGVSDDSDLGNFERFYQYLISTGMSLSAIALFSGVSAGVLTYAIRRGDVSLGTMYTIATYFRIQMKVKFIKNT